MATLIYDPFTELLPVTPEQKAAYDALELHGVRDLGPDEHGGTICEVDDERPQFYSLYLHLKAGGVECIGEFSEKEDAAVWGMELQLRFGYPLTYVCPN